MSDEKDREFRTLKWQNKQLGKQLGRAGASIFALRNENAALREAVQWPAGDRARLYNEVRELAVENRRLKEKLEAKNEGDQ